MPLRGRLGWLPHGRLVRRMILLFVLSSTLPILVASAVAYAELVRTIDRQQSRALRNQAKSVGMSLFGQLQLVQDTLELPPPADRGARMIPGGLGKVTYEPHPPEQGTVVERVALSWDPAPTGAGLQMLRDLPQWGLRARARLDPAALANAAAGEGAEVALSFGPGLPPLFDGQAILTPDPAAQWRTSTWVLPLSTHFEALDMTITVAEAPTTAVADLGLIKVAVPLALVAAVAMAIWFAIALLRRHLGPLQTLTTATRRIARREFDVRLNITTDDELGQLAHDFNSMAENLNVQFSTLESVAEVNRLLLEAPSLETILDALLPRMSRVLHTDRIAVLVPDAQSPGHMQVHACDRDMQRFRTAQRVELPYTWEQFCRPSDDTLRAQFLSQSLRVAEATVRVALLRQGPRTIGCLCLCWLPGNPPPPHSVQIERELADRLSVAMTNLSHEQELLHRARYDSLTGLANRDHFSELLERQIGIARSGAQNSALLYIDLDGFKNINDSAGHEAGDRVLIEIASRLKACAGPDATVARLGGDEFAVLVAASGEYDRPDAVASRMLLALHGPVTVNGLERPMSASIGLARIPDHGDNSETLLRNADIAMYKAKEYGRNRVAAFAPAMLREVTARVDIEVGLQRAIERDELQLHYQPIVSAARLVSAEALLRWNWTGHGPISPADFIPIAEQSDLIERLGNWSLWRVCADLAAWRRSAVAPDYVSINVAPRQLQSEEFVPETLRALAAHGLVPADLQLEITESAIRDGLRAQSMIRRLSDLGFRIAMDDFGTGYSSLAHLHRYPFDVVKVDRSFILSLPVDTTSLRLVDAIIRMAHGLEKHVIAEGVESAEQEAVLRDLGCDAMQGYLYGEPMQAAAFARYLQGRRDDAPATDFIDPVGLLSA